MVNPFNGEGIAYAMESGEIAARVIVQALARPTAASTETVLRSYPRELKDAYGGYYTLGRTFVQAIGHPAVMRFATRHGVKRPWVMRFTMKPVSYTHLDVYKRQSLIFASSGISLLRARS